MRLFFDIEANGLTGPRDRDGNRPKWPDTVHCLCVKDIDEDGRVLRFHDHAGKAPRDGDIHGGLRFLTQARELCGHNAIAYDLPVLHQLYGFKFGGVLRDSLVDSHLMFPWIGGTDYNREGFPQELRGYHSLEAWGLRMKAEKAEYLPDVPDSEKWQRWTPEMVDYCARDVEVGVRLWRFFEKQQYPDECRRREVAFADYIRRQIWNGVGFDIDAAERLSLEFTAFMGEHEQELADALGTWTKRWVTPKRKEKKSKEVQFNPRSREDVARALVEKFGWEPEEYTNSVRAWGRVPKMNEEALRLIDPERIPFRDLLVDWFVVKQRLSMLDGAGAQKGILPFAMKDERLGQYRIHGHVNHNGAVTGRCTHSKPNLNVPRPSSPYGPRMRALFRPRPGWRMVGADLAGIEARGAAHYLHPYDGGALRERVERGSVHDETQAALGVRTRQAAKNCTYAVLYGAQGPTVARTLTLADGKVYTVEEGERARQVILDTMPGLARLQQDVMDAWQERKYLRGVDGRRIRPRKRSAVLNNLIQGFGAVAMKAATVRAEVLLDEHVGPENWAPMIHVHDELQIEVDPRFTEPAKKLVEDAMRSSSEELGLRVSIEGESKEGDSWADTH